MTLWMAVEDEPDLYDLVLHMYEMMGVNGMAFTDGEEAVRWIDAVDADEYDGELPELALLDVRLPGEINGAMVGNRIRRSPRLKDMVVVLITAYQLNYLQEEALIKLADADFFMYKPLPSLPDLKSTLTELVTKRSLAK